MDTQIRPLDFSADLAALTRNFVERCWIDAEIDAWIEGPKPLLLLTGSPGAGKSAIAAHLTTHCALLTVHHFCLTGRASTINPGTAIRSLAAQLADTMPGYGVALANTIAPHLLNIRVEVNVGLLNGGKAAGVIINNLHSPDPVEELEALIGRPIRAMRPPDDRRLVIIIDGLDEAVSQDVTQHLPSLISRLVDLPTWVRVLCTSRHDQRVLSHFDDIATHRLDIDAPQSSDDVFQYAITRLNDPEGLDLHVAQYAAQIQSTAQGNFLVARALLEEFEAGRSSYAEGSILPISLNDTYRRYLRRFSDGEWKEILEPLLGTLSVAREPLLERELASFTGIRRTELRRHLGMLRSFLVVYDDDGRMEQRAFRLYHQTFRDFLLDEVANQDFWCEAADQHRRIADYYEASYPPDLQGQLSEPRYYWNHFIFHLHEADAALPRICAYLFNAGWLLAKLKSTSVEALYIDFSLLSKRVEAAMEIAGALRLSNNVLMDAPEQLSAHLCGRLANSADAFIGAFTRQLSTTTSWSWLQPLTRCLNVVDGPLRMTIPLGPASVESLSLVGDASRVLAACGRDLVMLDMASGRILSRFPAHQADVHRAAIDREGSRAISSGADDTIRIWDMVSCTELFCISGEIEQNANVAVVEDVGIARDGPVWRAWSLTTGAKMPAPPSSNELLVARGRRALVARGSFAVAGGKRHQAFVWDRDEGVVQTLALNGTFDSADIREDGSAVAAIGNGEISFLPLDSLEPPTWWTAAEDDGKSYHHISFIRGGVELVSISGSYESESPVMSIWDAQSGERIRSLWGHHTMVTAMAADCSSALCVTGSIDGDVKIWNLDRALADTRPRHDGPVRSLAFLGGTDRVLSAGGDGRLLEWSGDNASQIGELENNRGSVATVTPLADGLLALGFDSGEISVVRQADFVEQAAWRVGGPLSALCAAPSDDTLYSLSGRAIQQWNCLGKKLDEWILPETLEAEPGISVYPPPVVMSITPESPIAIVGYGAGSMRMSDDWPFWALSADLASRKILASLSQCGSPGKTAAASMAGGRYALTAHNNITIWDTRTGRVEATIQHPGEVAALATLPEQDRVLSVCSNGVARIWTFSTRAMVAEVRLDESLTCCAANANGNLIAVGDRVGAVHLFRVTQPSRASRSGPIRRELFP